MFASNVAVFNNIYDVVHKTLFADDDQKELYLFNVGSKRDYNPSIVPRRSYAISKNILRNIFRYLSTTYSNVNSLFINASTIDISKERELRPF